MDQPVLFVSVSRLKMAPHIIALTAMNVVSDCF